MLVQTTNIYRKSASDYDRLLSEGWFRGTGVLYRSELVCAHETIYSVQHIRLPITAFKRKKHHEKIFRRNRAKFRIEIGEPDYDERREELYDFHRSRFLAFLHHRFLDLMQSSMHHGHFDTKEIRVFDGDKLIAISYFDHGIRAMASMMCIFDPEYAKYSLGTYTMLEEIEYGRNNRAEYYYPGYVLDQPSSFDYKLKLGDYEWMGKDRKWYSKEKLPHSKSTGMMFREKSKELQLLLAMNGIEARFRIYPYFTLGFVMDEVEDLLKLPFLFIFNEEGHEMGASYDHNRRHFIVFRIKDNPDFLLSNHMLMSDDYLNGDAYDFSVFSISHCRKFDDFITELKLLRSTGQHESV
jgi:arginyl-tRNA--protein-N-Asp/Glu arginylyltransferase